MSIKIATIEDLDLVVSLAMKFAQASPYATYATEEDMRQLAKQIIEGPKENGIVLLYEDFGMIAGVARKFIYGYPYGATELAWWVDEDKRGTKAGVELLEAFEHWAKKVGCLYITMTSLDDQIGNYYEKKGYKLCERAYMKQI